MRLNVLKAAHRMIRACYFLYSTDVVRCLSGRLDKCDNVGNSPTKTSECTTGVHSDSELGLKLIIPSSIDTTSSTER